MKVLLRKLQSLSLGVVGEMAKCGCRLSLIRPRYAVGSCSGSGEGQVIVSLTSYGRRVKKTLEYTLISLLRQDFRPDAVIVWLDEYNGGLPKRLRNLEQYGIEFRPCESIGSYKKLIPALNCYPDATVVTVDDDVFYRKDNIRRLAEAFKSDPYKVYAHRAHRILFDGNGKLKPYVQWENSVSDLCGHNIFATGEGGCIYSKRVLHGDVCDAALFTALAPKADDVWFFFMELLNGTKCKVLSRKGPAFYPIDFFHQKLHADSKLSDANCRLSQNDVQIAKVLAHYSLSEEDFNKLVND